MKDCLHKDLYHYRYYETLMVKSEICNHIISDPTIYKSLAEPILKLIDTIITLQALLF